MKVRAVDGNEPTSKDLQTHKVVETVKKDGMTVKNLEVDPMKDNLISQEQIVQNIYQDERGHNKITIKSKPKSKATIPPEVQTPIEQLTEEEVKVSEQKAIEQAKADAEARIKRANEKAEELRGLSDAQKLTELIKLKNPELDQEDISFILDDEFTIREDEEWLQMGETDPDKNQKNSIRFKTSMQEFDEMVSTYVKNETEAANNSLKPKVEAKPKADPSKSNPSETSEDLNKSPESSQEEQLDPDSVKALQKEMELLKKEMKGELKWEAKLAEDNDYKFKLADKVNAKKRGASDHWKDAKEASDKFDDPWKGRRTTNTSWKPGDRIAAIKTDDGEVKLG